jgi:hypothetical protein
MKTIQETYAERLEMLVQRYGQTKLAEVINSHAILIQDWINSLKSEDETKTSCTRAIEAVRQMEKLLGLEHGWFDQPVKEGEFIKLSNLPKSDETITYQVKQSHNNGDLVQFRLLDIEKYTCDTDSSINHNSVKCVDIDRGWAITHLGLDLDDIALVTVYGDNMFPTLVENDVLFVDMSVKDYISDGIYLLSEASVIKVRRLQMIFSDIHIINDNDKYSNQKISIKDKDKINILGKIKRAWSLRRF